MTQSDTPLRYGVLFTSAYLIARLRVKLVELIGIEPTTS